MKRYRIEVGYDHDVKPGNIVGAIANESGLDAAHIGHIDIQNEFSLIDLPKGMPKDVFQDLKGVIVCGQRLRISSADESFNNRNRRPAEGDGSSSSPKGKSHKKSTRKKVVASKGKRKTGKPSRKARKQNRAGK